LGIGPNPQSPIPNPQSPIPNPQNLNFQINFNLRKISIKYSRKFKLKKYKNESLYQYK